MAKVIRSLLIATSVFSSAKTHQLLHAQEQTLWIILVSAEDHVLIPPGTSLALKDFTTVSILLVEQQDLSMSVNQLVQLVVSHTQDNN